MSHLIKETFDSNILIMLEDMLRERVRETARERERDSEPDREIDNDRETSFGIIPASQRLGPLSANVLYLGVTNRHVTSLIRAHND